MINQVFRGMGNATQLLFLILFSFVGLMLGNLLSGVLISIIDGRSSLFSSGEISLTSMRLSQVVSSICWLLVSSLAYLYLFQKDPKGFLKVETPKGAMLLLLTILLVIVVQPMVGFLGYLNQSIVFPESLGMLENFFKNIEELTSKMIARMISDKSVIGITLNILIIAGLAAVVEELFFRGCMQQLIERIVKNTHIAVWISAIIFSAVHMEFYGLLPRALLGALLGYLYVYTRNLWIPILAHFTNNLMAIVLQTIYYGTEEYDNIEKFDLESAIWLLPGSIALTALICVLIGRYRNSIRDKRSIA